MGGSSLALGGVSPMTNGTLHSLPVLGMPQTGVKHRMFTLNLVTVETGTAPGLPESRLLRQRQEQQPNQRC